MGVRNCNECYHYLSN